MNQIRSKDGTTIAYERSGSGPALILVDGALCSRAFGPSARLATLLAQHFTVISYDRRGRGQSGDAASYALACASVMWRRSSRRSCSTNRARRWSSLPSDDSVPRTIVARVDRFASKVLRCERTSVNGP